MDVRVNDAPGRAAEIEIPMSHLGVNVTNVHGRICCGEYCGRYDLMLPKPEVMRRMRQLVQEFQFTRRWLIDFRLADPDIDRGGTMSNVHDRAMNNPDNSREQSGIHAC
jgi:hypothetical protein